MYESLSASDHELWEAFKAGDRAASLMEIDLNSVYTITWKALRSLKSKPETYSDEENKRRQAEYWVQIDLIDENIGCLLKTLEEYHNLWDEPDYEEVHFQLMKLNFDETVKAIDTGPERLGRY